MRIEFFDSHAAEFEIVKTIRTCVFTNEQGADANGEFDAYDKTSLFALLYADDAPVGTARIAKTAAGIKIGRIAILKKCRGKGYGADIVKAVTQRAFDMGADKVLVDAQNYAVPFYEKLGFKAIGEEILDRGLPHIPMCIYKGESYGEEEK